MVDKPGKRGAKRVAVGSTEEINSLTAMLEGWFREAGCGLTSNALYDRSTKKTGPEDLRLLPSDFPSGKLPGRTQYFDQLRGVNLQWDLVRGIANVLWASDRQTGYAKINEAQALWNAAKQSGALVEGEVADKPAVTRLKQQKRELEGALVEHGLQATVHRQEIKALEAAAVEARQNASDMTHIAMMLGFLRTATERQLIEVTDKYERVAAAEKRQATSQAQRIAQLEQEAAAWDARYRAVERDLAKAVRDRDAARLQAAAAENALDAAMSTDIAAQQQPAEAVEAAAAPLPEMAQITDIQSAEIRHDQLVDAHHQVLARTSASPARPAEEPSASNVETSPSAPATALDAPAATAPDKAVTSEDSTDIASGEAPEPESSPVVRPVYELMTTVRDEITGMTAQGYYTAAQARLTEYAQTAEPDFVAHLAKAFHEAGEHLDAHFLLKQCGTLRPVESGIQIVDALRKLQLPLDADELLNHFGRNTHQQTTALNALDQQVRLTDRSKVLEGAGRRITARALTDQLLAATRALTDHQDGTPLSAVKQRALADAQLLLQASAASASVRGILELVKLLRGAGLEQDARRALYETGLRNDATTSARVRTKLERRGEYYESGLVRAGAFQMPFTDAHDYAETSARKARKKLPQQNPGQKQRSIVSAQR